MMIPAAKPNVGQEEMDAVAAVLATGALAQGAQVDAFESEFSAVAVEGSTCIAVNSGTSALHLSMLAAGVGPGDEVVVPSFTFAATANAVALTGATPVFADIDADTFCMEPNSVRAVITSRTRAIVPVHLYGHPAPIAELQDVCAKHGLLLLEDAAQAHLAEVNGRKVGTFGLASCFSFYPTKNMTSGEGGMVVTKDQAFARRVRLLRNQGMEVRYRNEVIGLNNRMTDIHAAIGRVQLGKLRGWTEQRQSNARFLIGELRGVKVPTVRPGMSHVFHQFTIRVDGLHRNALAEDLARRGIGSGVYYPVPVHRLPSFSQHIDLPNSDQACDEVLSLPVHPGLSRDDLERIVASVNAWAS